MTGSLDCYGQGPLVAGASAELPSRLDLAALGQMAAQSRNVFVINSFDPVDTEHTSFATRLEAATTTASTTWPPATSAFAAVLLVASATLRARAEARPSATLRSPRA